MFEAFMQHAAEGFLTALSVLIGCAAVAGRRRGG